MASGRPTWLATTGHNDSVANWNSSRGSGDGKPSWMSGDGGVYKTVKYLNLIGNPILYAFLLLGVGLAVITATRRNIRSYSSAVYLSVIFFCDVIWVTGNYFPDYALSVDENVKFNDSVCMFIQAFRFIGRVGSSFIIIALVLERVLMLSKPAKFTLLAMPRTAVMICVCCLVLATGLSGYYLYNAEWDPSSEKCNYKNIPSRTQMAPQSLMNLGLIGGTLVILVILNIILGCLICRKRSLQASDPVNNSLASARRLTKQLNRINLIAFIMSLQYILTNVPLLVAPGIYWASLAQNLIDFGTLKLIVKIIDLFALAMLASRAYIVGFASPKIRREARQALTCVSESNNMRQLAIDIRPKPDGKYNSNPDLVAKWRFQDKA